MFSEILLPAEVRIEFESWGANAPETFPNTEEFATSESQTKNLTIVLHRCESEQR